MKTILIPTDFSPVSINAVHYGVDMALAVGASVTLLHIYQVPVNVSEVPAVSISVEEMSALSEEKLDELRKALEHVVSGKCTIATESRLGIIPDEIESLADSLSPLAVIMGTKGASGIERLFLGSNTLAVIQNLRSPLIAVPPGAVFKPIRSICFACDLKEVAHATPVDAIRSFCQLFQSKLHVLNVDYRNRHFSPNTPEENQLLHNRLHDLQPSYHYIEEEDVVEGIHRFAETNGMDIIMTVPKKHRLLEGLFQKSHTRELIFHAHLPILCLHA